MILAEVDGKPRESSHLSGTSRDQVRRSDKQYFLNILKSRGIPMKLGQTGQWTWSELILFENRAIQDETGFTPGQIDRLHTRFFLTFLQCVRIKMLKMFMFLSMPQSKLSMTSIKSNLNWIWRVSDLFYWELSPFTVWRWHAQENEHQSKVI